MATIIFRRWQRHFILQLFVVLVFISSCFRRISIFFKDIHTVMIKIITFMYIIFYDFCLSSIDSAYMCHQRKTLIYIYTRVLKVVDFFVSTCFNSNVGVLFYAMLCSTDCTLSHTDFIETFVCSI